MRDLRSRRIGEHDRNAVDHGKLMPASLARQLFPGGIQMHRAFADGTDQQVEEVPWLRDLRGHIVAKRSRSRVAAPFATDCSSRTRPPSVTYLPRRTMRTSKIAAVEFSACGWNLTVTC